MTPDELVEGLDYYMENGFLVFTERYLRKRGFCCRSGCRHCPYGFAREEQHQPTHESAGSSHVKLK